MQSQTPPASSPVEAVVLPQTEDAVSVPKWWLKNEIVELESEASEAIDKKMYFTAGKLFGKAEAYKEILEGDE